MRLGEIARLVRSKNAGPFMLTLDVLFTDAASFERVLASGLLDRPSIADLFRVSPETIRHFALRDALTIKISFPREVPSGSPGDSDVYGCQYMSRLAALRVDERAR